MHERFTDREGVLDGIQCMSIDDSRLYNGEDGSPECVVQVIISRNNNLKRHLQKVRVEPKAISKVKAVRVCMNCPGLMDGT